MKQRDLRTRMTLVGSAALLVSATAAGAGPTLLPNTQPYRVKNPSAATGRSGNAKLAARALLAKDGKTVFDVTTGELDSGASAPGNIAKVQFKTFDGLGEVAWTKNYSSLTGGGAVTYTFDELHRGQPVQTQANVTGIDGKRTDVVTVTGNVKLRPDLLARGLDTPKQATVGAPVNIAATVVETNGDVGARANCVLFVDGAETDRANGIYVDGGGAVSCAFTPSFSAVGTHALEVRVTDVVPADWDATNNSVTGSIQIVSNDVPFYWSAGAYTYQFTDAGMSAGWYLKDWPYRQEGDWTSVWDRKRRHQSSYLAGHSPAPLSFPLTHVSAKHLADDALVGSFELADVTPDSSWGSGDHTENRVYRFDPTTHTNVYIVSYAFGAGGVTSVSTQKYAGDVTYFARGYQRVWNSYDGTTYYYYAWNDAQHEAYGDSWPMTSSARISLDIADARGALISANASIGVAPYSYDFHTPYQCKSYSWPEGPEQHCYESHQSESGVRGSASGVN